MFFYVWRSTNVKILLQMKVHCIIINLNKSVTAPSCVCCSRLWELFNALEIEEKSLATPQKLPCFLQCPRFTFFASSLRRLLSKCTLDMFFSVDLQFPETNVFVIKRQRQTRSIKNAWQFPYEITTHMVEVGPGSFESHKFLHISSSTHGEASSACIFYRDFFMFVWVSKEFIDYAYSKTENCRNVCGVISWMSRFASFLSIDVSSNNRKNYYNRNLKSLSLSFQMQLAIKTLSKYSQNVAFLLTWNVHKIPNEMKTEQCTQKMLFKNVLLIPKLRNFMHRHDLVFFFVFLVCLMGRGTEKIMKNSFLAALNLLFFSSWLPSIEILVLKSMF